MFDVNIDSCSIEKNKLILLEYLQKYDKNNTFNLPKLCPKVSGRGRKDCL